MAGESNLLAEGRLVNLSAAEGIHHPSWTCRFANQALSAEYIAKHGKELAKQVFPVPRDIDKEIARLKLEAMGIHIDG